MNESLLLVQHGGGYRASEKPDLLVWLRKRKPSLPPAGGTDFPVAGPKSEGLFMSTNDQMFEGETYAAREEGGGGLAAARSHNGVVPPPIGHYAVFWG